MPRVHPTKILPLLALVAVVYFAAVRVSLETVLVTQIWLASGLALAAVLHFGPVALLALVPAHLLAHLDADFLSSFSLIAAVAAAVEPSVGAWLLGRLRFDRTFGSARDVALFVLVGVVAGSGVAAAIGTAGLGATGEVAPAGLGEAFRIWWIGHGVGVLVVAPVLLLAGRLVETLSTRKGAIDAALISAALLVVGAAVFGPWPALGAANQPISFAVFPIVAWAALRLGPAGAAGANALVAAVAVWGTLHGSGPFAKEPREEAILFTWSFLSVTSVASLALAALVAARDHAERELREAYHALQAVEAATEAGAWIWLPDVSLHIGSARLRQLHGVGPDPDPIPTEVLLASIHPEDRDRLIAEFATAWRERGRIETEYRATDSDGRTRWLSARGLCQPVDPTRPNGRVQMSGAIVDVSARKRMEDAVRRGDRLASLGTFAAGVAHELNNPLGTILLAAETARSSAPGRDLVSRALDDILDDARRAARIVRSLLRFAKQEATERAALDLRDCVKRGIDLVRPSCRARGVALDVHIASRPLPVLGNATEIEQLVQNLVRNAAEACGAGGRLRLEADSDGHAVRLTVADDGRGMTASELEHAFDPFYTTRAREGGSGLGLSICHGIVAGHGGRIEIDSEPDVGTRVQVHLPFVDPPVRAAAL